VTVVGEGAKQIVVDVKCREDTMISTTVPRHKVHTCITLT
jgi:hypothetical protein